jgi:two-component system cell cycle response regulator
MSQPAIKVLVVDDEEANLDFFETVLTREQFTIVKARDGIEALAKFDQYQPDLILLDLMMPRLNGYDVCARLRRHPRGRHVPIIMLTGLEKNDTQPAALECGVDDFLTKPVEREELLAHIHALLKLRAPS